MTMVTLDSTKTTYEKLEKQYHGFIAPAYKIFVHNKDIVKEGMAVDNISVDMSTGSASDTASFSINNAYNLVERDFDWTEILEPGNTVSVYAGYTDRLQPIFYGYISNVQYNFSNGAPTMDITAMDISFFMMRSYITKIWKKIKITDVIKEIARVHGVTGFEMETDTEVLDEVIKNTESDHEFIETQAKLRNYEFFIVGKKLFFRKKTTSKTSLMKLEWGKNLMSFRVEHDIADQLSKVKVHGLIEDSDEVVVAESKNIKKIGSNSKTGSDIMNKIGKYIKTIHKNVKDRAEAQTVADSESEEVSTKLVSASASCIGLPEIRAGRYIDISGLGKKLDTTYNIVRATHTIDGSGYVTSFTLEGNAV